jgi:poly(A) polymerase
MLRLLAAADPVPALRKMDEAGVLQRVLPGAAPDAVLPGLVAVESAEGDTDPVRRLAALLPVSPEAALTIAERLRLSNRERDRLVVLVAPDPSVTADLQGPALRRVLYAQGRDRVRDRLLLAWAAESADESAADAAAYRRVLAAVADWSEPDFPLRGADVLALGVPPGPDVGDALDQVRQWWIEGDFAADRPQLLAKLAEIAGDRPSP